MGRELDHHPRSTCLVATWESHNLNVALYFLFRSWRPPNHYTRLAVHYKVLWHWDVVMHALSKAYFSVTFTRGPQVWWTCFLKYVSRTKACPLLQATVATHPIHIFLYDVIIQIHTSLVIDNCRYWNFISSTPV